MKAMRTLLIVLAALLPATSIAANSEQPNIIVVMADDHGQWALGSYGLAEIDTPNIDWLAEQGVRFENAMSSGTSMFRSPSEFLHGQDAVAAWRARLPQ